MPGPVSESYSGPMDPEEVALRRAIRTFTVEAPNDEPNGETECFILRLRLALEERDIEKSRAEFLSLMTSLAEDTRTLRIAAEKFFGGDFRKPGCV